MGNLARNERLAGLRATIANIEKRPLLAEARRANSDGPGAFLATPPGSLHEIFTDERRNAGSALGFALAQARHLLTPARSAVIYLQLARDSQEMGLPYGPGLVSFGFDPDALVLVRPATIAELLWAAEEAIACSAVAAVIADIAGQPKTLDFTASRRLGLRAGSNGTSMFLLRYGINREASAAQLRWHLAPALSARKSSDSLAPGPIRWMARLEKGVLPDQQNQWFLGWTKYGLTSANDAANPPARTSDRAALPRSVFASLGDRLPATA